MDTQEYFLEFVGRCRASREWMEAASDMLLAVLGRARGIGPGWHDTNKFFVDLPATAHDAFWVLLGLSLVERQEDAVWLGRSAGRAQYWRLRTLGCGFRHDQKTGGIGYGDNIVVDNFRQGQGLDEIPSRSSVFSLEFRLALRAEEILDSGNPAGELARLINDFDTENSPCFGHILEQKYLGETAPTDEPKKAEVSGKPKFSRLTPEKQRKILAIVEKNPTLRLREIARLADVTERTLHNHGELKKLIDNIRSGDGLNRLEDNAKLLDYDDFS